MAFKKVKSSTPSEVILSEPQASWWGLPEVIDYFGKTPKTLPSLYQLLVQNLLAAEWCENQDIGIRTVGHYEFVDLTIVA